MNNLFKDYISDVKNVLYNAIVLYKDQALILKNKIYSYLTEEERNWKEYYHHCTVSLGSASEEYIPYLETNQRLMITHIGKSDKCVAVKVEELGNVKSRNKTPHITCLVSPIGKPKDSNDITDWIELKHKFPLVGIYQEIKK